MLRRSLLFFLLLLASAGLRANCDFQQSDYSGGGIPGGNTWIDPFTATGSGSVSVIQVYLSGTANAYVGVYDDNAGAPGNLLASSVQTALSFGWNTVALQSPTTLTAATNYWVAVAVSDPAQYIGTTFASPSGMVMTGTYGALVSNPSITGAGNTDHLTVLVGDCVAPTAVPTAALSGSPTTTPTASPTAMASGTASATPSATPTPSASATPTATASATPTASATATPTSTATPTATPSATASATATASPTRTATPTVTPIPDCNVSTIVGNGTAASTGDAAVAVSATVNGPAALAVDGQGRLLIAELNGHRVRRIAQDGTISTVAGTGVAGIALTGAAATASVVDHPAALAVDGSGAIYIAERDNHRVLRVDPVSQLLSVVAGKGISGSAGLTLTASATGLALNTPQGLAVASNGDLYIADSGNNAVRKVTQAGLMSTVLGNGSPGFAGAGASVTAASAQLNAPRGISFDLQGRLLIADTGNHAVERLASGTLTVLAGTGTAGFIGTGLTTSAAAAALSAPASVAADGGGTLFISEAGNHTVLRLDGDVLQVQAGNGAPGFAGDGAKAVLAQLSAPAGVLVDGAGDLLVADAGDQRVRKLNSCGVVPFTRPSLPACYFGVALAAAADAGRLGPKDGGPAPSFNPVLAPNPALAGGSLLIAYHTELRTGWAQIYGLDGSLVWQGGRVEGRDLVLSAPLVPGIYFVEAQATDAWGGADRKLLKLAVVGR